MSSALASQPPASAAASSNPSLVAKEVKKERPRTVKVKNTKLRKTGFEEGEEEYVPRVKRLPPPIFNPYDLLLNFPEPKQLPPPVAKSNYSAPINCSPFETDSLLKKSPLEAFVSSEPLPSLASFISKPKKNVSFADEIGKALTNVRIFERYIHLLFEQEPAPVDVKVQHINEGLPLKLGEPDMTSPYMDFSNSPSINSQEINIVQNESKQTDGLFMSNQASAFKPTYKAVDSADVSKPRSFDVSQRLADVSNRPLEVKKPCTNTDSFHPKRYNSSSPHKYSNYSSSDGFVKSYKYDSRENTRREDHHHRGHHHHHHDRNHHHHHDRGHRHHHHHRRSPSPVYRHSGSRKFETNNNRGDYYKKYRNRSRSPPTRSPSFRSPSYENEKYYRHHRHRHSPKRHYSRSVSRERF